MTVRSVAKNTLTLADQFRRFAVEDFSSALALIFSPVSHDSGPLPGRRRSASVFRSRACENERRGIAARSVNL